MSPLAFSLSINHGHYIKKIISVLQFHERYLIVFCPSFTSSILIAILCQISTSFSTVVLQNAFSGETGSFSFHLISKSTSDVYSINSVQYFISFDSLPSDPLKCLIIQFTLIIYKKMSSYYAYCICYGFNLSLV